jgi:NADH-quinone oxidoreductase subunit N
MLFGMSLIYGLTGTTNLLDIAAVLRNIDVGTEVAFLGIFFLVVGFGFKVSAFPFQWWVPDTYEGAPVPVAAFLSVASKTAGFVGLLQIMFLAFGDLADIWRPFFAVIAVLTMTFGNLVALQQKHIVRLLAYSSIGQAGYILLPLGVVGLGGVAVDKQAFTAAIVYLLIYAFMETGAFAVAVAHGRSEGGGYQVSDYSGLFSRSPMLAVSMAVFLFSLAGVPPFAGWAAKFFVFSAVISAGSLWLAAIMAINTVIALFYYAAVARYMFFETGPTSDRPLEIPTLPRLAITTAALAVVIGGILPDIFGSLASVSTLL